MTFSSPTYDDLMAIALAIGRDKPWPAVPFRSNRWECPFCNYQWVDDVPGGVEAYGADPDHHMDDCPYAQCRQIAMGIPAVGGKG